MSNPLLKETPIPDFPAYDIQDFEPAIDAVLAENRKLIDQLLASGASSWVDLAAPLMDADDRLSRVWSIVSHYNSVLNSDELREIYKKLVAKLTDYQTEMGQNAELFKAYKQLSERDDFDSLNEAQRKTVEHILRDFHLSGVDLEDDAKARVSVLRQELSALSNAFSENVLDATQGWKKHIERAEDLPGLPQSALDLLASMASQNEYQSGYLLTLDIPCYLPVMMHCENRSLREEVYRAFATRASDQGPQAGEWDNSANIEGILTKRKELAELLGFDSYADHSLARKMADSVDEVIEFLEQLAQSSRAVARSDLAQLQAFAEETEGLSELEMWDIPYFSEKLKHSKYEVSQEAVKPYFPAPTVIAGMFNVVKKLFGVSVKCREEVTTYHPDVSYYEISRGDTPVAGFYLDPYARKNKRGGAWMADCRVRHRESSGQLQLPIAFLCCNFTPPVGKTPSLLTHDEVTTLFHEFGHGLHHMLTEVDVADVSGISGVPWDAVELPSQFLENWCWLPEAIPMISGHYETGAPLPEELLNAMLAAKNFQSGMQMVRQLEFALFDFRLHREYEPGKTDVLALLDQVRDEVSVKKPPHFNRFTHSFSHIFAGGYAAGYYSYKWAEVLAADAFSRFQEEGCFNSDTGADFWSQILAVGGARDAMAAFEAFRGRKPSVQPLLQQSGITSN